MITMHPLLVLLLSSWSTPAPVAVQPAPAQTAPAQQAPARNAAAPTSHAPPPAATSNDLAHELVASDDLARGDFDAWMQHVATLLATPHAAGATDEAALALMAQRADELNEPLAWPEAVERIQAANAFDPHARSAVARLARELRLAHMDHAALERAHAEDQFPEF